jgi:hypothetical protein
MRRESVMEARDDLQTMLLNGLPFEEREYVINKIAEVNDAKRRHLQPMTEPVSESLDPDMDADGERV